LDNLSVRKHSDISRKHSDSSISRVSSTPETSSSRFAPAETRPPGAAVHSANLGRPEGKSFALPDRPADLKAATDGRQQQQRRSSGGGGSSQTPPRSAEAVAATTMVGRQARMENGLPAIRPDSNNETVIGWKPIQTLHGSTDKKALTEKTAGVLTVEEEVTVHTVSCRNFHCEVLQFSHCYLYSGCSTQFQFG
jgi:hypothetical protein